MYQLCSVASILAEKGVETYILYYYQIARRIVHALPLYLLIKLGRGRVRAREEKYDFIP